MNRWVMLGFILAFLVLPSITLSVKANPKTIVVPNDDTPHIINEKNADNFPLMNSVSAQEITLPTPTPTESPSSTPTTTPPNSELFPTSQVVAISASATVAVIGFLVYFKKNKH